MGNSTSALSNSQLTAGIRRAQDANNKLYQLVDLRGGGELVQWTKFAVKSGDYSILDGLIEVKVEPFLYDSGRTGKIIAISELVRLRRQERNANGGAISRNRKFRKEDQNQLDAANAKVGQPDGANVAQEFGADDGTLGQSPQQQQGSLKHREVCWDIKQRGVMGETVLHMCLLNGTAVHNELAKRLIQTYPKLVNDIFISDEYYGQSALHQAITNEDTNMVQFLLSHGADVHQRCYGAFFCCEDQKGSRADTLNQEYVILNQNTNYRGRTYWGEYPLSFATCLGQADCFRMLVANKANPNRKDTNGNTVLHLAVLHDRPEMFDLAMEVGAELHIRNNKRLTPLTLAAKLGNKRMFDHVLKLERDVMWVYGGVTCAAYPLQYIDTIDEANGEMNDGSALSIIVKKDTKDHLKLLDGLMEDLLREKWNAFAKRELIKRFLLYSLYFIIFSVALYFRTTEYKFSRAYQQNLTLQLVEARNYLSLHSTSTDHGSGHDDCSHDSSGDHGNEHGHDSSGSDHNVSVDNHNSTTYYAKSTISSTNKSLSSSVAPTVAHHRKRRAAATPAPTAQTSTVAGTAKPGEGHPLDGSSYEEKCYLRSWEQVISSPYEIARVVFELLTLGGALAYITATAISASRLGFATYFLPLLQFPELVLFHLSWFLVLLMVPLRIACTPVEENHLAILAIFATTMNFMFFCRGTKFFALFVHMIWKIVKSDLFRVFMIEFIFCLSYAQSFYVIFTRCVDTTDEDRVKTATCKFPLKKDNLSSMDVIKADHDLHFLTFSAGELLLRTFLVALGESQHFYAGLRPCTIHHLGQILLVLYQWSAQILLINMLIASVTKAAEHLGEMRDTLWRRQRAKMILLLEHYLNNQDRLQTMLKYSRPVGTDKERRAFVVKRYQTSEELEQVKLVRAQKWKKFLEDKRNLLKRHGIAGAAGNRMPPT